MSELNNYQNMVWHRLSALAVTAMSVNKSGEKYAYYATAAAV